LLEIKARVVQRRLRRLGLSENGAWDRGVAASSRLNADTVRATARGKRVLFLDLDGGGRLMIPLEVTEALDIHAQLLAALARPAPADALYR
jgi:hypothetical protein